MMGLTWYLLGALAAGSAYALLEYSRKNPLNWISWSGFRARGSGPSGTHGIAGESRDFE